MPASTVHCTVKLRSDTAANWTSADPVLGQGEMGIEYDTFKFKIGNGVDCWNDITNPYLVNTGDIEIADKITHIGDTNTCIRFPANDTFTIETAGTEAFRVDSNQKILIGGPTASYANASSGNFQVGVHTSATATGITIGGTSTNSISFADDGDDQAGLIKYTHSDNSLSFHTDGATNERMRIGGNGHIGIGTTSAGYPLHVAGAGTVAYFEGSGGSGFIGIEDTDDNTSAFIGVDGGSLKFQTSSNNFSDKLVIDSSGNLFIAGATAAAADIALNANGSAIFQSFISAFDVVSVSQTVGTHNCFAAQLSGSTNASIKANGSSSFGNSINAANRSGLNILGAAAAIECQYNGKLFRGYDYATGNESVAIHQDGSASFAGGAFAVTANGQISTNVKSSGHIELDSTGSFSTPKIKLFSNTGAATFASGLINLAENGGVSLGSAGTANGVNLSLIAGTSPAASSYTLLQGYQSDGSTPAFLFKASGNATFSGNIIAGNGTFTGAGTAISPSGNIYIQAATANSSVAFSVVNPSNFNSPKVSIKHDGSATFAGDSMVGRTSYTSLSTDGHYFSADGWFHHSANNQTIGYINRNGSDGDLVNFYHAGAKEGSISVLGGTVSYNGAHLSRWSQLSGGAERTAILRGSVLSNLDEMCEWVYGAQDAVLYAEEDELPEGVSVGDVKTPAVVAGTEDNEQLNRMQVSTVEGDKNVSGVFQAWDDDDDTYVNDFYCAMTGDFVIRIAQGTTVARGDLLMSAGDGTAKPQDDDIVRSKTIAKVTSTNVSETYEDGSYCVPCVLMAC